MTHHIDLHHEAANPALPSIDELEALTTQARALRDTICAASPVYPLTVDELLAEPSGLSNRRRLLNAAAHHLSQAVLDLRGARSDEAAAERLMGGDAR